MLKTAALQLGFPSVILCQDRWTVTGGAITCVSCDGSARSFPSVSLVQPSNTLSIAHRSRPERRVGYSDSRRQQTCGQTFESGRERQR
ncbi:hypothetical protein JMJ77_0012877 [Colletotrichum scovillei]|uniref:Uncharacterized protein n=1 Tax=Colletotrichum scovillei TaxID=1209932 RepID=A0A9P7R738_9PEZI|nr:hypothetical protein JMJ77_0012877 [Colletotrichum scovillei]KAG7069163.1 hypothetical protein JMJ76_0002838 [Colletotrichum scovillei]KAG7073114.1 hypothetical protein JMJ78_0014094 [Colletotrichum scovillei]